MILRFILAIVALALIGGGLIGFNLFRDHAIEQFFANRPVPAVTVSTVKAELVEWTPAIDAIGTVSAARGVDLTVETTGIVRSISFTSNQKVEKDDLLLQMEDAVQRADLEAARTQARLDQQTLQRAQELRERGVGSEVTLESAAAAAEASAAQVEKLEAILQQKQLRAPFSGTIGIPRVDLGQYLQPGTVVATLQDLDNLRVDFNVPEQQLPNLKAGQTVRLGPQEDDLFARGTVIGINPKIDPASRLIAVRAEIQPGTDLTPGQFVRVKLELPPEDGVVALPQTAVITSLYGDHVYRVGPKQGQEDSEEPQLEVRQVFVDVGRRSGSMVEIRKGLEPGDVIVAAGQNRLFNGSPVTVENTVLPSNGPRQAAAR